MMKVRNYKCHMCGKKFNTLNGWGDHMNNLHPKEKPYDYSNARFFYFIKTGKKNGICRTCKGPTEWNEDTMKYAQYCKNPDCKKAYVKIAKSRMINKYGKEHLLDQVDVQKNMLSNRKISGKYKFDDGNEFEYVGSYEKDFLQMMDTMLEWPSGDLFSPSPHTYYYDYVNPKDKENEGRKFYIPDFYIPSLNLEIEIKQQTNLSEAFNDINKVKEELKDKIFESNRKVRYLKINDKNYYPFFKLLLEAKEKSNIDEGM